MTHPNAATAGTFRLGGELEVNRLGFGAMRVTGEGVWGDPPDRAKALQVLRRAVELGCNFIDTADSYGPNVSEALIAEALHPYPEDLVLATKGGLLRPGPDVWKADCRPEHLKKVLEESLTRLKVERIDLYQLHTVDDNVPIEDSIGALVDLKGQGKIRHIGVCNVSVTNLARARKVARVVSVQNRMNFDDRHSMGVLEICHRDCLAFVPWAPIKTMNPALKRIGARHGVSAQQVSLAWLLGRSPVVLPIPGTSSLEHLEDNVRAASLRLSVDDLLELAGTTSGSTLGRSQLEDLGQPGV